MSNRETQTLERESLYFDPDAYVLRIHAAADYIQGHLPKDFVPRVALTLGSGGLGEVAALVDQVAEPLPYKEIPGFTTTTVAGHEGMLVAGNLNGVPTVVFKGRKHFYEFGGEQNLVTALKEVTFCVYVAKALEAEIYFATNAAGGLNPKFNAGDLMIIMSHLDLFFPNPLAGPQIDFMNPQRFQPQHTEYRQRFRTSILQAADRLGESAWVHEGVYCALPGPTYESRADSQALRSLGVDAVGMSIVPEVIVATNLGMETVGVSLITNVVAEDGTNATSHEEVMAALEDPATKRRIAGVTGGFFEALGKV